MTSPESKDSRVHSERKGSRGNVVSPPPWSCRNCQTTNRFEEPTKQFPIQFCRTCTHYRGVVWTCTDCDRETRITDQAKLDRLKTLLRQENWVTSMCDCDPRASNLLCKEKREVLIYWRFDDYIALQKDSTKSSTAAYKPYDVPEFVKDAQICSHEHFPDKAILERMRHFEVYVRYVLIPSADFFRNELKTMASTGVLQKILSDAGANPFMIAIERDCSFESFQVLASLLELDDTKKDFKGQTIHDYIKASKNASVSTDIGSFIKNYNTQRMMVLLLMGRNKSSGEGSSIFKHLYSNAIFDKNVLGLIRGFL